VTGRRGRRSKQLLDDLKETRIHCNSEEEALDPTVWKTRFGKGLRTCCKPDYGITLYVVRRIHTQDGAGNFCKAKLKSFAPPAPEHLSVEFIIEEHSFFFNSSDA
jgi:hypothetical protein